MARSVFRLDFTDFEQTEKSIHQVLTVNRFHRTVRGTEVVWKRDGILKVGQYLKVEYTEYQVVITAWVTEAFGGSSEYALGGFTGILPKQQLLDVIEQIKFMILR